MKSLPSSEVYEKEFLYLPWGRLISEVLEYTITNAPKNASVLDLMCGPGYLLGKIGEQRPDLKLKGVDIDRDFIDFAKQKYPQVEFEEADLRTTALHGTYGTVICTAGLHHLQYDLQERFLTAVKSLLAPDGFAIIADPYVDNYTTELERKISAAKLGYEYLVATMKNGGDEDVQKACIDIMHNDVLGFEFKSSIKKIEPSMKGIFTHVERHKTWPDFTSEFGDYYFILN